ncbi:hypothetical protein RFW90_10795, partial [Acinetobacter baumannii]|nr:hypothetical protein [Acinetobacter baumannii]
IPLQFDKVYTEGISKITAQDVKYAEELGFRIKHLGIARRAEKGIELRVQQKHLFCSDIDPTADWLLLLNMVYCFYTVGHIPLHQVELG